MGHVVAASWALAQTVDGVLKMSREAAIAATSDNVQAIALLACERFGATLAISALTRKKIEDMVRKQAATPMQQFLKAKIGYAKGGSIDVLSQSPNGIRFLSLATVLISSCNNFDAATTLERMVADTAEEKEFSPTVYQLMALLEVLGPRLNKVRFLDEVVGYQDLFFHTTYQAVTANIAVPSPEAIHDLTKSFRELARIGEEDTRGLRITVGPFAAWVATFARWSIDLPPRIIYESEDKPILEQTGAQVTICISNDAKYKSYIEIETIHEYKSVSQIVLAIVTGESKPALATGMVSLKTHAKLSIRELGFHDDLGQRVLEEALPYALHLVSSMFFQTNGPFDARFYSPIVHSLNPFPDEEVVRATAERYLGWRGKTLSNPLNTSFRLGDLPIVRLWAEQHRSMLEIEPEKLLLQKLSYVIADILALSLLLAEESLETTEISLLLLHVPKRKLSPLYDEKDGGFQGLIEQIFEHHPGFRGDDVIKAINWALKLVGHDEANVTQTLGWVASSHNGQIILPRILLAKEIPPSGFASLLCLPGTLMLESQGNQQFARILSKGTNFAATKLDTPVRVSARLNVFPKEAIRWGLSSKSNHLELSMGWTFNSNTQRPLNVIKALMCSVMTAGCPHSIEAELSVQQPLALLAPGSNRMYEGNGIQNSQAALFPLYGNEELKLLALASTEDMKASTAVMRRQSLVINRGACLDCGLGVYSLFEGDYVIL